jgi:hypothetical protein
LIKVNKYSLGWVIVCNMGASGYIVIYVRRLFFKYFGNIDVQKVLR